MKTAIGFLGGQFGDCIIQEPTIRAFLAQNPEYNLILACTKRYFDVLKFYEGYSPRIVGFHAYESYDDAWPTKEDIAFIQNNKIDLVFNAMAQHKDMYWPKYRHQTIECGDMFNIKVESPQIHLPFPQNVPRNKDFIAVSLFPNNAQGVKTLSAQKAQAIVDYCRSKGYGVLQINGPQEPVLKHTVPTNTDYYSMGVAMLGCKLLVVGDTGLSWLASAFEFPTIGLYSSSYYPFCTTSKNWNPFNKNARYLEADRAENIPNEVIFNTIDELLN